MIDGSQVKNHCNRIKKVFKRAKKRLEEEVLICSHGSFRLSDGQT